MPSEDNTASSSENGAGNPSEAAVNGGDSKRKDVSRTPEQVLLGKSGAFIEEDEYETTEPVDEPPKRKAVQLSSINPARTSLQRKDDGTVVLSFPDSSEVLIPLCPQLDIQLLIAKSAWFYLEVTVSR